MNKAHQFFLSHLVEYAASEAGVSVKSLHKVAQTASFVGGFSYTDCIKKLAAQPEEAKKLVNLFGEEIEDEETGDDFVDEGEIKQHDYRDITTQNHPWEFTGTTPYSTFAIPEAISA